MDFYSRRTFWKMAADGLAWTPPVQSASESKKNLGKSNNGGRKCPPPPQHWMDQEVLELSMQRITAATSCDHRRNENGREGKWGGGRAAGGIDGLHAMLLRGGGGGGGRKKRRVPEGSGCSRSPSPGGWGGAGGDGELCVAMQMHRPVCQESQTVEDRNTGEEGGGGSGGGAAEETQ